MTCGSTNSNFSHLLQETQFNEKQIKTIFQFYKSFSHNNYNGNLTFDEFKNCFGIIGRANQFILKRLINLINSDKKLSYVPFSNYVKFLNIVNNGSNIDKANLSFKFFDLQNNGIIKKEEFCEVMYEYNKFLSDITNSKVKTSVDDLKQIFDKILEKTNQEKTKKDSFLLKEDFISLLNSHNEEFDLFNIFHNIYKEETSVKLTNKYIEELLALENKLNELYDKMNNPVPNNKLFLGFKKMIKADISTNVRASLNKKMSRIRKSSMLKSYSLNFNVNNVNINNNYDNSNSNSNYNNNQRKSKYNNSHFCFYSNNFSNAKKGNLINDSNLSIPNKISKQTKELNLPLPNFRNMARNSIDSIFEDDHEEVDDDVYNSFSSDNSDSDSDSDTNNGEDIFSFIKLSELKLFPDQVKELNKKGFASKDTIIIKNYESFLTEITNIIKSLRRITKEIKNKEKKYVPKRRQGISVKIGDEGLNLEDFVNSYKGDTSDEKGIIHLGSDNVNLVVNMMMGIKKSIYSLTEPVQDQLFKVNFSDVFAETNTFKYSLAYENFNFSSNNSKKSSFDLEKIKEELESDAISKKQCVFVDYAPKVFDNIRRFYGLSNDKYFRSIGPENFLGSLLFTRSRSLKELVSTGKSKSFFYFSYDSQFVLKTISEDEFEFFKRFLPSYYNYIQLNPETLIQRFYGLHSMTYNEGTMHFVVMNNCFNSQLEIHYKYDLKGSSYQRSSLKSNEKSYDDYDFNIPLKDNDLKLRKEIFKLNSMDLNMIKAQIKNDSEFLASNNINDYSFLIGIHKYDKVNGIKEFAKEQLGNVGNKLSDSNLNNNEIRIRKPFYEATNGGLLSKDYKSLYFVGIIDIFTQYGGKKKMEHAFKSVFQGSGISCQPPMEYSNRFIKFMSGIFSDDAEEN